MRMLLGISTVLGVIGVISAFALFYLGERVFHLDRAHIQTLMYLKLSVAGHLTIFLMRTRHVLVYTPGKDFVDSSARHAMYSDAYSRLRAVYDAFGLGLAGSVWAYALAWFLLNDRIKILANRISIHQVEHKVRLDAADRRAGLWNLRTGRPS